MFDNISTGDNDVFDNKGFISNIIEYVDENKMLIPGDKIVVGVSGGADSVSLLCVLCEISLHFGIDKNNIIAVHVNHMIRGEEALGDQHFVEKLCEELGICCEIFAKDIPAFARENSLTVEEAGRRYRYECFNNIAEKKGCTKIAVAHNRNDLVETMLFNMVRGSGLKGITGIPAVRDNIIRPLLSTDRADIEKYLSYIGRDYRTDSTNLSVDYDRNKIRHIVLPALMEINNGAIEHLLRLSKEAEDSYKLIKNKSLANAKYEFIEAKGERSISMKIGELNNIERLERYYVLYDAVVKLAGVSKDITQKNIDIIMDLLSQDTGKRVELPYGISVRRSYDRLIISKLLDKEIEHKVYNVEIEGEGQYIIPDNGLLKIRIDNIKPLDEYAKNDYTKVFDYGKIRDKLCVRNYTEDDYIIINEQGNTKKVGRIFIDKKIDRAKRPSWPVVACASEALWIVGLRYNEAYRVDESTEKVMIMEYIREGEYNG